ncbi:MAG TPA: hypothetical protein VI653_19380 [Steroidobacteraceae bacterium]
MWKSTPRKQVQGWTGLGTPPLTAAAVVAFVALLGGVPAWGADQGGQPDAAAPKELAVWTTKEVQFTYIGFTTTYSCDGLRDDVREMLLQLGARKDDLKVYEMPCSGPPDRPNPFPGVKIKMSVLTPAPSTDSDVSHMVQAQWKTVKLPFRETGINAAGKCELLEQFKKTVLPLFTTRNVDLVATCVPHQLSPLGTKLQADVLVTNQKDRQASSAETR